MSQDDIAHGMGITITVVDDEEVVVDFVSECLRGLGCTVDAFTDPVECFSRLDELRPDILVADLAMPDVNGIMMLKQA